MSCNSAAAFFFVGQQVIAKHTRCVNGHAQSSVNDATSGLGERSIVPIS